MPSSSTHKSKSIRSRPEFTESSVAARPHLEQLLALAPAAIGHVSGPEHRWTYVNPAYIRVTGRKDPSEFLNKTFRESLPELEGQGLFELLDDVYRTGRVFVGTEMKVELNRSPLPPSSPGTPEVAFFNFTYQPTHGLSGEVEGILVHAVDVTQHVLARQAVEVSEKRLHLAQSAAHLGTWEWDPALDSRTLSREFHGLFGSDPASPNLMQEWLARVHTADKQRVEGAMEESIRTGNLDFEYRYQHPQLGLRWLYCKGGRLHGDSRMFGVVLDVTERKKTEEALQQSEERFRAIVETTPECVKLVSQDGAVLHMNSAGLMMVGASSLNQIEGTSVYDLIVDADREKFREFNAAICRGERGSLEFEIVGIHGQHRHMETYAAPLVQPDGSIVQLAVSRDVTLSKNAEEAQRRLAAIVESSDDAIASKDLNGVVTSWNKSAEKLFGYTAEEMIGRPITLIIPPELHHDETIILGKLKRGEKIDHFETVRVHKNGERIDVSLTISPVKDEHGKVLGAAKIVRNITESKKIENALRTTEKLAAAGRLAATVAHEINNPLEAVMNFVYLAKISTDPQQVKEYLNGAEEELERVSHLTKQTLGFYRESKKAAPVRIGSIIEPLLAVFSSRIKNKGINVTADIRQDPEIVAISGEIRQLLANLVSNSMDAMGAGGTLRIRLSAKPLATTGAPGVRVTVADTGSGIARADLGKLFEPFFTTKRDVGTGLGLWVSRTIIERHGGTVRIKSSTHPGRSGTVFSVSLPVAPPDMDSPALSKAL